MKVLKGIAIAILSFLLFLSLSALGLVLTLNFTVLNPDFVTSELDKVNAYSLAKDQLYKMIPSDPQLNRYLTPALDATLTELKPWIKEQFNQAIRTAYDYLKGKTDRLIISIPTAPIKQPLKDNLWKVFQQSPPPEVANLPPAQLRQYFDQFYDQLFAQVPATIQLTQDSLSPDNRAILERVRHYLSYFDIVFWGLIGLTALLILGIVLITREVKASARGLGINFTTYGALWLAVVFAAGYLIRMQVSQMNIPGIPPDLIPRLVSDILMPLQWFSIAFLATGIVLIVVSYAYKPRQAI